MAEELLQVRNLYQDQRFDGFVLKAGKKHKRGLGRMVTDIAGGIAEAKQGWDLICYHGDAWLLQVAIRQGIEGIRAGVKARKRKGAK